MDIRLIKRCDEPWYLKDLVGRTLARITTNSDCTLQIDPEQGSILYDMERGPFASLEFARKAIVRHVGGLCQVVTEDRAVR